MLMILCAGVLLQSTRTKQPNLSTSRRTRAHVNSNEASASVDDESGEIFVNDRRTPPSAKQAKKRVMISDPTPVSYSDEREEDVGRTESQ